MRTLPVLLALICLPGLSACESTKARANATDRAALSGEAHSILTRPLEYGIEQVGDAQGEASSTTILGFFQTGDESGGASGLLSIFGAGSGDPLENTAAFRAATSVGGDAFYLLTSVETESGVPGIYSTRTIRVTGKALKILHLGPMDQQRTDRLRALQSGLRFAD